MEQVTEEEIIKASKDANIVSIRRVVRHPDLVHEY